MCNVVLPVNKKEWQRDMGIAYNQALDDFRAKINCYLAESSDFADFVVTDNDIDIVINELKGVK